MNTNQQPLVTVLCLAYNEESFIRECLDSVLMQQTTFPYEILVYDDASKDETPNIIQEYADKYPDLFRITLFKENNYQKGLGFYGLRLGFTEAQGKYIAYIEGDDYWSDPLKLQKQVDFMDSHPDYGCCCTRYRFYYQDKKEFSKSDHFESLFSNQQEGIEINHDNYFHVGKLPQIQTAVYKRDIFPQDAYYFKLHNQQDDALFYCMTLYGKIWLMNEATAVYRRRDNSVTRHVEKGGSIAQNKMLHDIWMDCWQYDKSEVLRDTVLWSISTLCTSTIRYAKRIDMALIRKYIDEYKNVAGSSWHMHFYKNIIRAFAVRIIKRPYKR